MNPLDVLKKEHEQINLEIMELEAVGDEEIINYSNLIHCFKKLCELWDKHENKEEKVFRVFEKERIKVPVEKMTCDHIELKGHIKKIKEAINSGSELEMKKSLSEDLKEFIEKIKKHRDDEDEVLYTIAKDEFTPQEWAEMSKYV